MKLTVIALLFFGSTAFAQDEAKITKLIDQLGGDELDSRDTAESELVRLGRPALATVRKALTTADGETKSRLERVVKAVTELRWMTDLAKAKEVAAREKKPILVFSTIGDVGGYV
jgi:hypothetical protein